MSGSGFRRVVRSRRMLSELGMSDTFELIEAFKKLEAELSRVRKVAEDAIAALDYYGRHGDHDRTCPTCAKELELRERLK